MKVIFLNGAGSSGKSSIAKALVYLSDKPWLTLDVDSFIEMMHPDYVGFGDKGRLKDCNLYYVRKMVNQQLNVNRESLVIR